MNTPADQPIDGRDTSIEPDPSKDPAQAEWDRTAARDEGMSVGPSTATGADPAELPADDDEIPAQDLPGADEQPDSQGAAPLAVELGDDGQGDLAPEDL
ncbi:sugar ABC transporter ATPase [Microbacterium koreense]|uniref:Sugar ABC transporter ATPase n=1 Tax=Microbacterium koreense TaxID=323761 RepID=A0ABW2ZPU6_9MICO